jgi:PKD repeat protein
LQQLLSAAHREPRSLHAIPRSNYHELPLPLPGVTNHPTDPDNDGLYEDLKGNGIVSFADVSLCFSNFYWIRGNEPVSLFDFNKNGGIDCGDLDVLNQRVL